MSVEPARTVLFTGFPGFIGARLIRRLLGDDPTATIVALVEARMADRARAAASVLSGRIAIEVGDITAPRLGLTPQRYAELAGRVTSVAHLAAVYDLAVPMEIAEAVNVTGTQNVLDFCRAATNLERHNYVSTAYVAGLRSGRVLESDLVAGQTFKNHYESTKFAAEVLVRASMDEIPTTIYRPGVVVGDSRSGETQKFDGPYYVLRYVSMNASRPLPMLQTGSEDASFNVVPVDFVVDAMAAGIRDRRMTGETLHLVDPSPVSAAELVRLLTRTYADRSPTLRLPQAMVETTLRVGPLRRALAADTPVESIAYLNHPVQFDTTRATALLAEHGLQCPPFESYVDAMVRFFRDHEADPAYRAH